MKNIIVGSVVAVSSLLAITACANVDTATSNTSSHNAMPQGQMQSQRHNMMAGINLTPTQQAQIQAIRQNNRGTGVKNHDAILQVLTPEQRQKLQQMQAQHMSQGGHMTKQGRNHHHMNKGRGNHHMSQGSGGRMMHQSPWSQLNLTADQQAKIQAIRQNNRATGIPNHQAIMQVLTPEQRQKLQQMQSQHMNQGGHMMKQGQN